MSQHGYRLIAVLLVLALPEMQLVQGQTKEEVSILWIGNSLTKRNDLPMMVAELAQAAGQPYPGQERELPGGCTFERH